MGQGETDVHIVCLSCHFRLGSTLVPCLLFSESLRLTFPSCQQLLLPSWFLKLPAPILSWSLRHFPKGESPLASFWLRDVANEHRMRQQVTQNQMCGKHSAGVVLSGTIRPDSPTWSFSLLWLGTCALRWSFPIRRGCPERPISFNPGFGHF